MPNANYLKGRRFEYFAKKEMEKYGYSVMRTSGSHGPFDLVAIHKKHGYMKLVQCKTVKTEKEAQRLIKAFKEDPPFVQRTLPVRVLQMMWVKVPRKGMFSGIA